MTANSAWESLLYAHAVLVKQFTAEDVWGDLTVREYDVLYTLSKCEAPIRLGELNKYLLLSQPAMSRMVDRLAERGLISREPDPADRRGLRLSLTDKGEAVQKEVGRRHARSVARAMNAALAPGELRQLELLCRKLIGDETDGSRTARPRLRHAPARHESIPRDRPEYALGRHGIARLAVLVTVTGEHRPRRIS